MVQDRIFGIGFSKTGTTSLTRALRILGYKTNHFPYSALRFEAGRLRLDMERISRWDAVTDSPVALFYDRLAEKFENAKFILTVRDIDSWLDSCECNHVWPGDYVRNKGIRKLPHIRTILSLHHHVFGSERFHRATFRDAYERHVTQVREYFAANGHDLLVTDICGGDGWEPLCRYLGAPIPDQPFPRDNVGKFKRTKRASRRVFWRTLSALPSNTLHEKHVRQIIATSAYTD